MYVKVRVKLSEGNNVTLKIDLPNDLRDFNRDTIDDFVGDYLQEQGTEYVWYNLRSIKK